MSLALHHCLIASFLTACGGAPQSAAVDHEAKVSGSLVTLRSMSEARAAHTVTTLPDGRVLIVGGLSSGPTASAELFDPATRQFALTGSLRTPRASHSATRLADGRVLIAGGYNGSWLASTEIYDPRSGTFSAGPALTTPRSDHLAVALSDGRVLFVGGTSTAYTFLATAELLDPIRLTVVRTGSMAVARESHTGVLLPNGDVLVAGGHAGRGSSIALYDSAELYDPVRGVFRTTGPMTKRRHKHAGVLLADGRVLITGGSDERDERGAYRDAEVYNESTGRFAPLAGMHRARYKHHGTMTRLADGRVLIAGGAGDPEIFDPATERFVLVPASNALAGNFSAATTLSNGQVFISGGYGNGAGPRRSAWLFVP